jgi:hypothetical protein
MTEEHLMNATDILKYRQLTVQQAIDGFPVAASLVSSASQLAAQIRHNEMKNHTKLRMGFAASIYIIAEVE